MMSSPFASRLIDALPQRLLVDMSSAYRVIDWLRQQDTLPTIDGEALMSQIVALLDTYASGRFRPQAFIRDLDMLTEDIFRIAEPEDFEFNYVKVRKHLYQAIVRADDQLKLNRIYVYERLPYDYVSRKHCGYALLQRHRTASF